MKCNLAHAHLNWIFVHGIVWLAKALWVVGFQSPIFKALSKRQFYLCICFSFDSAIIYIRTGIYVHYPIDVDLYNLNNSLKNEWAWAVEAQNLYVLHFQLIAFLFQQKTGGFPAFLLQYFLLIPGFPYLLSSSCWNECHSNDNDTSNNSNRNTNTHVWTMLIMCIFSLEQN